MEFSVTKSLLLNELSTTQGVVERKTTIPILSNLLVEAKGNRLTITATDLELSIRTSCEAKVKKEGAGTIPAKKLLELVRLLPEGEIKCRLLENHWVEIVSERKKYKLVGMAKENFPALPVRSGVKYKLFIYRKDPLNQRFNLRSLRLFANLALPKLFRYRKIAEIRKGNAKNAQSGY